MTWITPCSFFWNCSCASGAVLVHLGGLTLGMQAVSAHPAVATGDVERDHDPGRSCSDPRPCQLARAIRQGQARWFAVAYRARESPQCNGRPVSARLMSHAHWGGSGC